MRRTCCLCACCCRGALRRSRAAGPQIGLSTRPALFHRPLDQLLDLNVRDGLVYYRALRSERGRLDRYVSSLNVARGHLRGLVAGREGCVLDQRLQRHRSADGHQRVSDSGQGRDLSCREHPADPRRVRAAQASRRRPIADARRDREDRAARVQGAAGVSGARARRRRQRPAAQRGVHRGTARRTARLGAVGVRRRSVDAEHRPPDRPA